MNVHFHNLCEPKFTARYFHCYFSSGVSESFQNKKYSTNKQLNDIFEVYIYFVQVISQYFQPSLLFLLPISFCIGSSFTLHLLCHLSHFLSSTIVLISFMNDSYHIEEISILSVNKNYAFD